MWVCHSLGMAKTTVMTLARTIKTEADAYEYMEELRWPDGPFARHCGSIDKHYFLTPKTARGAQDAHRRSSRSGACGSARPVASSSRSSTGTVFHGTQVPLHTWLMVVFEMCANKNGIAAREIERKYGVAPKTAWFMTHRLREAMKRGPRARSDPAQSSSMRRGSAATLRTGTGTSPAAKKARPTRPPSSRSSTPRPAKSARRPSPTSPADPSRRHRAERRDGTTTTLHTDSRSAYGRASPESPRT